ncbi:uncharacterized protein FIBRA_00376 [Fibroporia radiculosa]|uniref:Ubiquinol-cytochrome c chaperone domain-containing protein n=1 Tax=Fibroporia radiculosa TaxID=599839 RepID=J4I7W7_9APHY|nr:uncharacterized protein FIBRA_00376 [Fibroporia radiculosa]CCL98381.1 predicted protein [Fibroporia radiculosa]
MLSRSAISRGLRHSSVHRLGALRLVASGFTPSSEQPTQEAGPAQGSSSRRPTSWLTRKLEDSPAAKSAFLKFATFMGYGSPKQVAGRRAFAMYERLCVVRPDEDKAFWQDDCHLPPTFQSWFTVVNLHVWMLTVRLRALPPPHGMNHIQALIDHFFLDVEDRVRAVLQPATPDAMVSISPHGPYTTPSAFYVVANGGKPRPKGKAPEMLVSKQMKIFKEQWAGMGMSFDVSLLRGDADMAAVIWRNLLGGRGARGIVYPSDEGTSSTQPHFRRSVNLVGGEVEKVKKIAKRGLELEEARDDGSGVHDYLPSEADKYVAYPELMVALVSYIRRELVRLQNIPDEVVMGAGVTGKEGEGVPELKFGRIVQEGRALVV